jgi:vitamin B12 transporter
VLVDREEGCLVRSVLAGALAACMTLPVQAQAPEAQPVQRVAVFADRLPLVRADGVQAVTVLDRAQIERRAAASASDLLRELPGVHVDRMGVSGAANVYVRGAEPNHTLVLVDGVRVNDPTDARGGSYDLGAIPADDIERIEVLRGASSAQFGADAMGGIVNIVTRRASSPEPRGEARIGAGGGGYREAAARAFSGWRDAEGGIGVSRVQDGLESDGGRARVQAADARVRWRFDERGELSLVARHAERDATQFPESSGGVRLAADRTLEHRAARESLATSTGRWEATPRLALSLTASWSSRSEDRESPAVGPGPGGFVPASTSATRFERTGALAQASLGGLPRDATATAGVEVVREDGRRDSLLDIGPGIAAPFRLARDTRAVFAQFECDCVARVVVGVRHDDVDPGRGATTGSAGARYELGAGQALRAQWAQGFKPPSFFALGDPLVGNPDLRDETSRSVEAGWEMQRGDLSLQATAFDTRFHDLVDFDPDAFRLVNRAGARMRGGEVRAARAFGPLRPELSYTYADARLQETAAPLRNRPRHRASLALAHEEGRLSLRVAAVYVGRTFDFSIPTGEVELPGRTTFDVVARWRSSTWAASLAVDNVFDRRYEDFVGFTAQGARVRGAIQLFF